MALLKRKSGHWKEKSKVLKDQLTVYLSMIYNLNLELD